MAKDDIGVEHTDGYSRITNVPRDKIKAFRNQVKHSSNKAGSIDFAGVKKIDVLKPNGEPDYSIFGEEGTNE